MQKIQHLHPAWKMQFGQRSDPVAPVAQHRFALGVIQAAPLGFCGHLPAKRLTRAERRYGRPHQALRSLDGRRFLHHQRRTGPRGRRPQRLRLAAHALHLPTQPQHPRRIQEHRRRLGLRITPPTRRRVGLQTGHFRVHPVRIPDSGTTARRTHLQLARIQVDRGYRRGIGIPRTQTPSPESRHVAVPFLLALATQPHGQPLDMLGADRHLRQARQGATGLLERALVAPRVFDLRQYRRAVALRP